MKNFYCFLAALGMSICVSATEPPASGGAFPDAYFERLKASPHAFMYKRALNDVAARAAVARAISASANVLAITEYSKLSQRMMGVLGHASPAFAPIDGGPQTAVTGNRLIPVLAMTFPETSNPPYPVKRLQTELFDGPWPTGTMTDYYHEVSGGLLTVKGTVKDWAGLGKSSRYYVGDDYKDSQGNIAHCFGLCSGSRVAEFVASSVGKRDDIDWGMYDNDGPDGIPNSGDDDGYVDFVAFVHPNFGAECDNNPNNIWSHRSSVSSWGRPEIITKSPKKGGGFIAIDDYVVMPAVACDKTTMIQIGVFAHEFGHAFGLPDLYDTDPSDGKTAGLGNWCLMASGSWGGDGKSPQTPSHMSPWAKAFLGWIDLKDVDKDMVGLNVAAIEDSRSAYKMRISSKLYYIVNSTNKSGFNRSLPMDGLQIWKINETVVRAGLPNNRVNATNFNRGVSVVEADGLDRMMSDGFRGGDGDIFPGSSGKAWFDAKSKPLADGAISVCDIHKTGGKMFASLLISNQNCTNQPLAIAQPVDRTTALPPSINRGASNRELTSSAPQNNTVATAVAAPIGSQVTVSGILMNSGSNFFDRKSRRIVLIDKTGNEIDVQAQMSLEKIPSNKSGGISPRTLPELLNKEVTIKGRITDGTSGRVRTSLQAETIETK